MKTLVCALAVFASTPAFAYIDAFPTYITFGDTVVGSRSIPQTVVVTNRGTDDVNGIQVFPSCGTDFDVSGGTCFGILRPNQSCYVDVTFTPFSEGYRSCSIYISGVGSSSAYVTASGQGVKREYPYLAKKGARSMPKKK